jgi:hypothetical protein
MHETVQAFPKGHRSKDVFAFPSGETITLEVPDGQDLTISRSVWALMQAVHIILSANS